MNLIQSTFKNALALCFISVITFHISAQDKDKRPSPPAQATASISDINVTIDYSQPAVKDRKIWDGLVPYGKVWRTGANEATWIEISEDVKVNNKSLPKGKYSVFTIPGEEEWTIIFNETWSQWGAYEYDSEKDVVRITAKPTKSDKFYERFTVKIDKSGTASFNWENISVPFKISK